MAVTDTHEQYTAMCDDWRMMEDALAGPRTIKRAGTLYLPKTDGQIAAEYSNEGVSISESNAYYAAYRMRAEYPMWVKDSLRTMIGLVARQEPEITLPSQMEWMEQNATADGFSLRQLFIRVVRALLTKGRKPLLIDIDTSGRPYIATYTAETAPNWRTDDVDGRQDLTLVVFKEKRLRDDSDEFSPQYDDVFRVLDLHEGRYRVRLMDQGGVVLEEDFPGYSNSNRGLPYIPCVFAGTTDNSVDVDEIPLLTMAQSALIYYRLSADLYSDAHSTSHAQAVVTGAPEGLELNITGPMLAWVLPDEADAKYLERTGSGAAINERLMERQRNAAAEAGAKVIDVGGQESGDARKARQNDQHSSLYSVCVTAAEAIEQALKYAADWMGRDPDEVVFKVEPSSRSRRLMPPCSPSCTTSCYPAAPRKRCYSMRCASPASLSGRTRSWRRCLTARF
ncbi:hypothetical protein A8U91_01323 [Halomonas elongata]|uniref:DUF4055 domain-containing protein n=1 Tax=Halomonas elongata TaxID=2746 RepID=A0A1B8P3W9_HALEL|nr:hypothetical protein A8U91_01323 [Halomonas elongata]